MDFISKKTVMTIGLLLLAIFSIIITLDSHFQIYGKNTLESFANFSNNYIYFFVHALAGYIGILGARKIGLGNTIGKGLLFLGIAMLFNALGQIFYDYYISWLKVDVPYPSIAEIPWGIFIILQAIGMFYILKPFSPKVSKNLIITSVITYIVSAIIIVSIIHLPEFQKYTWAASATDLMYMLGDAVLLTLAIMTVVIAGGRIFNGLIVYTFSLVLMAVADIMYSTEVATDTFMQGGISDLIYNLSGVLFALGIYMIAKTFIEKQK